MIDIDRKRILGYQRLAENGVDKRIKPLPLETFVTFVSLVVKHSA